MHPYSIDTNERERVYFYLAVISLILSWSFHIIINEYKITLPWYLETPSAYFLYGLLYEIFDKWGWKILKKFGLVVKTPDLNGEWSGTLKTSFNKYASEIKATLKIFQNWTKIKIILTTQQSESHSETASFVITTPEGVYLSYQYINFPKADAKSTMHMHQGTVRLFFNEKENTLIGEYYAGRGRQNFGTLSFKKIQSIG